MTADLVDAYLTYLNNRGADPDGDFETWEALDELVQRNPGAALDAIREIVARCSEDDVAFLGASALESLLYAHPRLIDRFESEIRTNDRFFKAFQYVAMTGVPLDVQRRINDVLRERGVDPKFLVEYDESVEDD